MDARSRSAPRSAEKDPSRPPGQLALATGRSVSWVKKWRKRLGEGDPTDPYLLCSHSRAHSTPYFRWDPCVETRIVEMRLSPPEDLGRTPGPRALLYYLPRDPVLQAAGVRLPRSSRTVWKLLRKNGCILLKPQKKRRPTEPREPLEEIQMDFKDVSSVSPEHSSQSKRQHVIEVCNFVDAGTSVALFAQAREDFHEQTALEAVIIFLQTYGCPRQMTFDRDPRWVGGSAGRDFPSPLRRLLLCLGIEPNICPAHRPDKNAFVERYHRSYGEECLQRHRPATLQQVCEVTAAFLQHYNWERPHQGRACHNIPPRVAFPSLPTLPALPQRVDPDRWLVTFHHQMFLRRVGRDGCVNVDLAPYYIDPRMAGCQVLLQVEAQDAQFVVWHAEQVIKKLPIKGLIGQEMAIDEYLKYIRAEALAYQRRSSTRSSGWDLRQPSLW
jgi:transposase InsO family protein